MYVLYAYTPFFQIECQEDDRSVFVTIITTMCSGQPGSIRCIFSLSVYCT